MAWQWWHRELSSFNPAGATYEHLQGFGAAPNVTTETQMRPLVASAGNLKKFTVKLSNAPGSGKSRTFTLRVNAVDSALTVTISDLATTGSITTDVALSAGDRVHYVTATSGSPASTTVWLSLAFEPTNAGEFTYPSAWSNGASIINSIPRYNPALQGCSGTPSTESDGISISPIAGTITAFYVNIRDAPGVGTNWTFILSVNGVEAASTSLQITAGNTTANLTGLSVAVAVGDLLSFKVKAKTGSPTTTYCGWGFRFEPTTAGNFIVGGASTPGGPSPASGVPEYTAVVNTNGGSWSSTESTYAAPAPFDMTMVAGAVKVTTAPGAGKSWTFRNRKNGANGTIVAVIADANTTANDTAHTDAVVEGDLLNVSMAQSGTPAAVGACTYALAFNAASAVNETQDLMLATAALLDATVSVEVNAAVAQADAAMLNIDSEAIQVAMDVAAATAAMLDASADLAQLMGGPATAIAAMLDLTVDVELLMEAMAAAAALLDLELETYEIWGAIRREIDPSDWSGTPVAYLEVHARTPDATPYKAYLYNETDGLVVAGSDVSTLSTETERVRSGAFSFAAGTKVYRVDFLSGHPMFDAVVIVDVG